MIRLPLWSSTGHFEYTCRKIRRIMYPEIATCLLVFSHSSPFRRQRSVQLCLNGHGPSTERHVNSFNACTRCYPKVPETGMPHENSLYSCAPLGIAKCALYEARCQAAFCCEDMCVLSVHFCDVMLVLFCDRTDLLRWLIWRNNGFASNSASDSARRLRKPTECLKKHLVIMP